MNTYGFEKTYSDDNASWFLDISERVRLHMHFTTSNVFDDGTLGHNISWRAVLVNTSTRKLSERGATIIVSGKDTVNSLEGAFVTVLALYGEFLADELKRVEMVLPDEYPG
jgi:hypothetical protein